MNITYKFPKAKSLFSKEVVARHYHSGSSLSRAMDREYIAVVAKGIGSVFNSAKREAIRSSLGLS